MTAYQKLRDELRAQPGRAEAVRMASSTRAQMEIDSGWIDAYMAGRTERPYAETVAGVPIVDDPSMPNGIVEIDWRALADTDRA